ncbi:MAG: ABC transporter permease [Planctomycetota bacterium]|nr:ABC transporter permease [Planctomycetota bacterium]
MKSRTVVDSVRGPLAPLAGLLFVVTLFTIWGAATKPQHDFLTGLRLALIAKQTAIVGVGAIGMTAVIAAGGIDLAVGSLLALCSVVLACALRAGLDPALAVIVTIAVGTLGGALNGRLVTWLRLAPFIVTLGTMLVYRGLAEQVSAQTTVHAEAPRWITSLLDHPEVSGAPLVAWGVWVVLAAGLLFTIVMRFGVFGRHVIAIGANENAARFCGIAIHWTKIRVYALLGACAAIAGIFEFANLGGQGSPTSGNGYELEVIAAVVIGGGSLTGGRASVLGSLAGALMMTTLRSGCVFVEISDPIQKMVMGAIILAAVTIDRTRAG